MASSGTKKSRNKIIVRGIPNTLTPDKVIIYFQKHKNVGGGDVESVTFPKSVYEKDVAIVCFDEPATVQSVLKHKHELGGRDLKVEEYLEDQVFATSAATISPFVLEEFGQYADDKFEHVESSTGVNIKEEKGKCTVRGEWYQVKAAFELIESLVKKGSPAPLPTEYLSRTADTPNKLSARSSNKPDEVTSVMLDKDMFGFMKMAYSDQLDSIKRKYGVKYHVTVIGDASKIQLSAVEKDSKLDKAVTSLNKLFSEVQNGVHQDCLDLSKLPSIDEKVITETIQNIKLENPRVYISKMIDEPQNFILIAKEKNDVEMALSLFQQLLQKSQHEKREEKPQSEKPPVFDKDIFEYIRLTRSAELKSLRGRYKCRLSSTSIDEAVSIKFKPEEGDSDATGAFDAFSSMYNRVSNSVVQKDLDLSSEPDEVLQQLNDVFAMVRPECPRVWMNRMHDPSSSIIFIAEDEAACNMGVEQFKYILDTKRQSSIPSEKHQSDKPIVFDKDIFEYIRLTRSAELKSLQKRFKCRLICKSIDEAVSIKFEPDEESSDPIGAFDVFRDTYDRVCKSIVQKDLDLSSVPKRVLQQVDDIFTIVRPECPRVLMNRMHDPSSTIIFIAEDEAICNMGVEQFKYILNTKRQSPIPSGGGATNEGKTTINVDSDMFAYVQLVKGEQLGRLWTKHGVNVGTEKIGDCVQLEFLPENGKSDVNGAKTSFLKLYNDLEKNAVQNAFDLKGFKLVTRKRVDDAIDAIKRIDSDIHIGHIAEDTSVLLIIADCEDKYNIAKSILTLRLKGE